MRCRRDGSEAQNGRGLGGSCDRSGVTRDAGSPGACTVDHAGATSWLGSTQPPGHSPPATAHAHAFRQAMHAHGLSVTRTWAIGHICTARPLSAAPRRGGGTRIRRPPRLRPSRAGAGPSSLCVLTSLWLAPEGMAMTDGVHGWANNGGGGGRRMSARPASLLAPAPPRRTTTEGSTWVRGPRLSCRAPVCLAHVQEWMLRRGVGSASRCRTPAIRVAMVHLGQPVPPAPTTCTHPPHLQVPARWPSPAAP